MFSSETSTHATAEQTERQIMPNDERTPLLAGNDDPIISKLPEDPITGESINKDPEALDDGPKIPGVKLSVILPAMAIGV